MGGIFLLIVGIISAVVIYADSEEDAANAKYERICVSRHQKLWKSENNVWCLDPVTKVISLPVD